MKKKKIIWTCTAEQKVATEVLETVKKKHLQLMSRTFDEMYECKSKVHNEIRAKK